MTDDYRRIAGKLFHVNDIPTGDELEPPKPEPRMCSVVVYAGSWHVDPEPPELCDEECDPGYDVCPAHLEELYPE